MEIQANLRLLQDSRDSLLITFADRNQRFQSFLVDIDRDRGMVALDELIPNTGERFLQNGEAFRVEAFHEGVRIAWECERPVQFGEHDGVPCYWAALPPKCSTTSAATPTAPASSRASRSPRKSPGKNSARR